MGEYATRISDGARIKTGTCEDMCYMTWDDVQKVRDSSIDFRDLSIAAECRYRLPFLDEVEVEVGEYEDYSRTMPLSETWPLPDDVQPGIIQLSHPSGLLVNVPCYHGEKLPTVEGGSTFWNGKNRHIALSSARGVIEDGVFRLRPVLACRFCGRAWRVTDSWASIAEKLAVCPVQRLMIAKLEEVKLPYPNKRQHAEALA